MTRLSFLVALSLTASTVAAPALRAQDADSAAIAELQAQVRACVDSLPAATREVVELHWFEGLSFAEIGEMMGQKPGTLKVRAHRGYKKLRAAIEAQGGTGG